MTRIKYVGLKQNGERAFLKETGIEWFQGDVNDVEDEIAKTMLKHPDVFALADTEDATESQQGKELDDLLAQCALRGIKTHHKNSAETLRAKLANT